MHTYYSNEFSHISFAGLPCVVFEQMDSKNIRHSTHTRNIQFLFSLGFQFWNLIPLIAFVIWVRYRRQL